MDNNNWLNQLLLLGVGTTSIAAEKLKEVSEQLVTDGKLNPDQAAGLVNALVKQVQSNQGDIEAQIQRQIRNIMQDMGVARQSEVDELRGRIDEISWTDLGHRSERVGVIPTAEVEFDATRRQRINPAVSGLII